MIVNCLCSGATKDSLRSRGSSSLWSSTKGPSLDSPLLLRHFAPIVWKLVFDGSVRKEPKVVKDVPALSAPIGDSDQKVPERLVSVRQRRPRLFDIHLALAICRGESCAASSRATRVIDRRQGRLREPVSCRATAVPTSEGARCAGAEEHGVGPH